MATQGPLLPTQLKAIVDRALSSKLPSTFPPDDFAEAGGLMSYGPSYTDNFRRAAAYMDKILKGAKPGDLPIEQPTKFEMVFNMKTAKAMGLTIPQSVLLQADRVIKQAEVARQSLLRSDFKCNNEGQVMAGCCLTGTPSSSILFCTPA